MNASSKKPENASIQDKKDELSLLTDKTDNNFQMHDACFWFFRRCKTLCKTSCKTSCQTQKIKKGISLRPDLRKWSPPTKISSEQTTFSDAWFQNNPPSYENETNQCCKCLKYCITEIDQPRDIHSIPAYNPKRCQDDHIGRCPLAYPFVFLYSITLRLLCCRKDARCCFSHLNLIVPCCSKIPTMTNPHLNRDRCPTLTYFAVAWTMLFCIIKGIWGDDITSQCRFKFAVNPSRSVIAILNHNATYRAGSALGASEYYSTETPTIFDATTTATKTMNEEELVEEWMYSNNVTFVYADTILPKYYESISTKSWLSNSIVRSSDITQWSYYPSEDSASGKFLNGVLRTAGGGHQQFIPALSFAFFLTGANAFSNRWIGWGTIFWSVAIFKSVGDLVSTTADLKFCHRTCQNIDGTSFNLDEDIPSTIPVAVYQNGTCENTYQANHYNRSNTTLAYLLTQSLFGEIPHAGQPLAGCGTWRTELQVPTSNLQVIDLQQTEFSIR